MWITELIMLIGLTASYSRVRITFEARGIGPPTRRSIELTWTEAEELCDSLVEMLTDKAYGVARKKYSGQLDKSGAKGVEPTAS